MSDAWERCPDCQDMIKRFGRDNLEMCEFCTHLSHDTIHCACDPYSRDGAENNEPKRILKNSGVV